VGRSRARPHQFRVIWENSRCSILFHLLVPGGRVADGDCQTGLNLTRWSCISAALLKLLRTSGLAADGGVRVNLPR
jgi:hypothetical protein